MRKLHRSLAMVGGVVALGAATFASAGPAFATDVPQKADMGKDFQNGKKVLVDWLEPGTPEFEKFLRIACARASDDADVSKYPKYYETAWAGSKPKPARSQPGKEVKADDCGFTKKDDETTDKLPSIANPKTGKFEELTDSNSEKKSDGSQIPTVGDDFKGGKGVVDGVLLNCTNNQAQSNVEDSTTKQESHSWEMSTSVEAGIKDIFSASLSTTVGDEWSTGTVKTKGVTMEANAGEKVWLDTYQKKRKVKGDFEIKFPDRVKGHYIWYMKDFEMETPVKSGIPVLQSAPMNKKELDKCATPPVDSDYSASFKDWLDSQNDKNDKKGGQSERPTQEPTDEPTQEPTDEPTQEPTPTPSQTSSDDAVAEWQPQTFYAYDTKVTFDGVTYRCLQEHQSNPGWEPAKTPSLWQKA